MNEAKEWYKMPEDISPQTWDEMTEGLKNPEQSDWECELFGVGRIMVLVPSKGKEPNSFWRLMQFLILGNRWKRRVLVSKNKKFTFDLKEGNIGIG